MARINYKRAVSDVPYVIGSVDPAVAAYVAGLPALNVRSNTAGQLFGFAIAGHDGAVDGGTAYLVSAEAYKRIATGRLS